jgi:predicted dehydrogenase
MHRRRFLRTTSAAAAGISLPYLIPSHVLGGPNRPGANERVNVAIIGLGGRAQDIAGTCFAVPQVRIAAVCDCYAPRSHDFAKRINKPQTWKTYEDFRQMFAQEKLDGVMVETTTHARAWVVVQAMQAGLDTYIEKPMCLTIGEGREMVKAARKYNRVTQVGTQQRSMPINNWASDLVKNGALGKTITVLAPNFVGPFRWTKTSSQNVKGPVEPWWDRWTNQTELRPCEPDLQFGWARWWDYDGGGLCFGVTGWGTHSYDQINRALGTDETGPVEVILEEPVADRETGKFVGRKTVGGVVIGDTGDVDTGTEYHQMAKLTGPRAKVTMKFAAGHVVKLHLDGDRGPGLGAIFVGEKGKIEINRNKLASNPKEIVRAPDNPGPIKRPETAYHIENWAECIKTRKRCNADIEFGQRSSSLCYLVNIVRDVGRVGQPLKWDPMAERFTNCDEANKLLSRPRRKGYELPDLG